jgi:hypothetical protein
MRSRTLRPHTAVRPPSLRYRAPDGRPRLPDCTRPATRGGERADFSTQRRQPRVPNVPDGRLKDARVRMAAARSSQAGACVLARGEEELDGG